MKIAETKDHPRECGKNLIIPFSIMAISGSPPRVREKLVNGRITSSYPGITPASAGKTLKDPIEIANPD
ncbi:hypothetical protein HMPREF9184_00525 [Streptococcus sp. oral taxon 058 str. F0407]|nr:hypothetical protein HMPREF9184_00525 [Streptococcus sp. oral taxon 058 str. F0407]